MGQLQVEVRDPQAKCEGLEGRSRRKHLRLTGVEEGAESGQPTHFVSHLLKELLDLDEAPLLNRAHRSLRAKSKPGEPPRVFILRVHYTHTRDEIYASPAGALWYIERRISIFIPSIQLL